MYSAKSTSKFLFEVIFVHAFVFIIHQIFCMQNENREYHSNIPLF